MGQRLGLWVLAAGAIALAFGGLRLYSVVFADPAASGDITASEGGMWIAAVVVGVVLLAVGWFLRRTRAAA